MSDLIRDSAIGQIIRYATRNRYLLYPEERDGFKYPYDLRAEDQNTASMTEFERSASQQDSDSAEKTRSRGIEPIREANETILVDWYNSSGWLFV
jgi:DHA1 family multidrug resistance protein-like MFS transporter